MWAMGDGRGGQWGQGRRVDSSVGDGMGEIGVLAFASLSF